MNWGLPIDVKFRRGSTRFDLLRKKLAMALGLATIISGVGYFEITQYFKMEERNEFRYVMGNVMTLDSGKRMAARVAKFTNGYPITLKDLTGWVTSETLEARGPEMGEEQARGELVFSNNLKCIYILGRVGVPARVRFLRDFNGYPAGSEIIASVAVIMGELARINGEKKKLANEYGLRTGHPMTLDDIQGMPGVLNDYEGKILYVINPVGVPATARVLEAFDGLSVGTEISCRY